MQKNSHKSKRFVEIRLKCRDFEHEVYLKSLQGVVTRSLR